jgi:hypothetical protein
MRTELREPDSIAERDFRIRTVILPRYPIGTTVMFNPLRDANSGQPAAPYWLLHLMINEASQFWPPERLFRRVPAWLA